MNATSPTYGGDDSGDRRKSGRELSTSKRAAQNRAAQRAFRQRKEQYINSLKDQVKGYQALAEDFHMLTEENKILREYVIQLQQALKASNSEYPTEPAQMQEGVLRRRLQRQDQQQDDEDGEGMSPSYILQQAAAAAQEASQAATGAKDDDDAQLRQALGREIQQN